ncbi:hypothetical protein B0H19DRAFT_937847, partial [Mycena capillaripes]
MPKEIETKLEKRIRKFLWAEKTSVTVNQETVYAPADIGGKNLLDIVARNEAIAVTWLKTYLSFGPDRPLWCFVADEILALKGSSDYNTVREEMRMNAYLQSWFPKTSVGSIGKDLAGMIKVGRKYGLEMDAIGVSREIQGTMPIWYHRKSYADRIVYNQDVEVIECIQNNHGIRLVRHAVTLGKKMDAPRHRPVWYCRCSTCRITRTITHCKNPHGCYCKARELLDALEEKWDPREPQPEDYETELGQQGGEDEDTVVFDPRITTSGTIADTFRIFTNDSPRNLRDIAPDSRHVADANTEKIVVYTDGSAINNGRENSRAGAGIYFGEDDPRNRSIRIPESVGSSNNVGEMVA